MVILSPPSPKKAIRKVPWILIIMFINLVLLCKPAKAIKCYSCTCWPDCIGRKNLFKEVECDAGDNSCITRFPESGSRTFIAKQCYIQHDGATEDRKRQPGMIIKICYTDLCNDEEAGGIKNPNPKSKSSSAGIGMITGYIAPLAMIMAYAGGWLIN